jgi:hypothetical protein
MGEWMYKSTFSWPRRGQLHAPATLPLRKGPQYRFLFLLLVGWDWVPRYLSPWVLRPLWPIVQTPDDRWGWFLEQLVEWKLVGETEVLGEILPQRHLVHHKIPHDQTRAWTPDRRGGKPVTNRLRYGAALTVPIGKETWWDSESVWTKWRGEKSRDLNSDPSAVQTLASSYADCTIPALLACCLLFTRPAWFSIRNYPLISFDLKYSLQFIQWR